MGTEPLGEHLTLQQMAALLDRELSGEKLDRVEAHLASCDACRREVVEVSRTVNPKNDRRPWYALGAVAAAASIVGVLLLAPGTGGISSAEDSIVRTGGQTVLDEGVPGIEVVSPTDAAVIARESSLFVWRSGVEGAVYRFTLTDENGDVLWTESTSDSVLSLTSEVTLRAGTTYYWFVDALLDDGSSATTGFHEFRTSQ